MALWYENGILFGRLVVESTVLLLGGGGWWNGWLWIVATVDYCFSSSMDCFYFHFRKRGSLWPPYQEKVNSYSWGRSLGHVCIHCFTPCEESRQICCRLRYLGDKVYPSGIHYERVPGLCNFFHQEYNVGMPSNLGNTLQGVLWCQLSCRAASGNCVGPFSWKGGALSSCCLLYWFPCGKVIW